MLTMPTMLTACQLLAGGDDDDDGPPAPTQPLSQLRDVTVHLSADLRTVRAVLTVDPQSDGACPTLDDDFQATLDGVPMQITGRGASEGSLLSGEPCRFPSIQLPQPAPAAAASIAMTYSIHTIMVDLADLLAPRSAQLVPDGAWAFTPGQTITVQWSPASDLSTGTPIVDFIGSGASGTGEYDRLPVTVSADHTTMTLVLPMTRSSGQLEFWMHGNSIDSSWPHCTGAICRLSQTPQLLQDVMWK